MPGLRQQNETPTCSSASSAAFGVSILTGRRSWSLVRPGLGEAGTRLKLGLHDPAGIVTRIEAIGRTADRAVTLPRAEQEADGRMELIIDASLPPDARFEVTTYCDLLAEPMVVRVVTIGGASLAPAAPDPKSLRAAPPRQRVAAVDTMADVGDPLPWWWVVAGVVTLSLVGGAVWQETR